MRAQLNVLTNKQLAAAVVLSNLPVDARLDIINENK